MFNLFIERSAEKDFKKLPTKHLSNVISKIKGLSKDSHPKGCKKLINNKNFWRIRIGNYRVIYEVIESEKSIRIYKVKHRKDVYKS